MPKLYVSLRRILKPLNCGLPFFRVADTFTVLTYIYIADRVYTTSRCLLPGILGVYIRYGNAHGGRVVDFTNYVFASMQKAFSNRETPIGKVPTHY